MKNGPVCPVWLDSLTDHIKRSLDHPNSVCTAARQPRTLKHWHILHCATEGVLTQTHRSKNLSLCNTLCSVECYLSLCPTNMGGNLEKKISEALLRVIRVAWPVCACVHSVCGGRGTRCLIRALRRSIRHASYNKQHRFDQITVSLPLKLLPCLHACHPAGHAHKHSCRSLNPDTSGLTNREGKQKRDDSLKLKADNSLYCK